jgi:ribonuclease Z
MKIKFLGIWSSHIAEFQRNVAISLGDKIVVEFGPHTMESLFENHIDPRKIETVLISHMHLDHFSGLPELLWYRAEERVKDELTVMGPRGIRDVTEKMLDLLNTPSSYKSAINVNFIEGSKLDFISSYDGNHAVPDNIYLIDHPNGSIVYSGDTSYSENVVRAASEAKYLIHEMTYADNNVQLANFWKHSTYSSVMRVAHESNCKKVVPIHFTSESLQQAWEKGKKNARILFPFREIDI